MKCPRRIIVIGDIHGDDEIFISTLKMCNVINNLHEWIGGDTYVIQMGDILGGKRPTASPMTKTYSNRAGEILMNKNLLLLDSQARLCGGRVMSLIGNHELHPYYFHTDKRFIDQYVKKIDSRMYRKIFNCSREKFWLPGKMGGKILGERPLLLNYGQFLFIHGDVSDDLVNFSTDIDYINKNMSMWLKTGKKIPSFMHSHDSNPVFLKAGEQSINRVKLLNNNIKYIIVGNKPSDECKNIFRPYSEMSRAFGGNLNECEKKMEVLEIIQEEESIHVSIINNNGTRAIDLN